MAPNRFAGWVAGGIAVLLTALASRGLSTRRVELNLGPGDGPFAAGFEANRDVENKVGWHWTTYAAEIDLPFAASGSDVEATVRYARMFGEEAVVDVTLGGVATETFRARGGEIKSTILRASDVRGPLVVGIRIDSHERRNMGLRMDRIAVDVVSGPPLKLRWTAVMRPVIVCVLLFAGLMTLGSTPMAAGGLALVGSVAFALEASVDLFGAWRQIRLAPEMIIVSIPVLFLAKRWMERSMSVERPVATWLAVASLVTMLCRLVLVSHPDFYYPDLLTHARVANAIRDEGLSFFLHPAAVLSAQGAWTKPVLGGVASLPYAVMFHSPFALLAAFFGLSTDQIEVAMKAVSCLVSVLPIVLAGVLAKHLGMPPLSALLLCVIPTYTSRLSLALLPALFGHVFDLAAVFAMAKGLGRDGMRSKQSMLAVAGALFLGHLAYTSSVINEGLLAAVLAVLLVATSRPGWMSGSRLAVAEGVAAGCAFALYYRHFVGDVFGLVGRLLGVGVPEGASSVSVYPVEGFWSLLFDRTNAFFGWEYVGLALLGLALAGLAVARSPIVQAWVITYLALILLRAKIPDVFRYGHETLFLTPLVAILGGTGLILLWRRGGVPGLISIAAGAVLVLASLWEQWLAVAEQFGNAL